MDTESIKVRIEAITTGLQGSLSNVQQYMKGFRSGMADELKLMSDDAKKSTQAYESTFSQLGNVLQERFKGINGVIDGVRVAWAQFAVVAGMGAIGMKAINETVQMTVEANKLGRALGIGATQASTLALAIGDVYGTTDQYIGMVKGMNRQLKTNEEAMQAMGLVTRDANGQLKDQQTLVMEGLGVLQQYKEGTDRNLAATALFGRGVDVTSEMLQLNAEKLAAAEEKATSLNIALDQDGVAAVSAYRAAMNDAQDVLQGLWKTIGDALMPVMTELLELFATVGPAAILILRGAIGGLLAVWHGFTLSIKVVWELLKAFFRFVVDTGGAFASFWSSIAKGDFQGAIDSQTQLFAKLKSTANDAFSNIADDASKTRDKLYNLFGNTGAVTTTGGGDKSYEDPEADAKKAKAASDAEALANKKAAAARAAAAEHTKMLNEEFAAFKQSKALELEETSKTYNEKLRIAREVMDKAKAMFGEESAEYKKAAMEVLKIERDKAAQLARVQDIMEAGAKDAALRQVELAESTAEYELNVGAITYQQRLAKQVEFENQRFAIELTYLDSRIAIMDRESEAYAQALLEREKLQFEHAARITTISQQSTAAQLAPQLGMVSSMRQSFADLTASVLTSQMSLKEAGNALLKGMLADFTKYLAQKLAASKLFAAAEIAINKAIAVVLRLLGFQSAATAISTKSTETTSKIAQSAAVAGAGAAESQASIPYIGPVLAIAAMGAIFAAVMGMQSKGGASLPSARGGFDIPAGVNPLTQLHEQEMVLPKEQADAIRNMTSEGGGTTHYHISAIDGDSVRKFFMDNKRHLAAAGKAAQRGGSF